MFTARGQSYRLRFPHDDQRRTGIRQTEKETLGKTFVCKKFRPFIYGKPTQGDTDHKPLQSISKKPMSTAPPKPQKMILQLQRYKLEVRYVPGREIHADDALYQGRRSRQRRIQIQTSPTIQK